jgi:UDP-N-acetylmuramate-alanine ligase
MQEAFRDALAKADAVYLAPAHRAEKLGTDSFDTMGVVAQLKALGRKAYASSSSDDLLLHLLADVKKDVRPRCVVFFSNGSFGGVIPRFAQEFPQS